MTREKKAIESVRLELVREAAQDDPKALIAELSGFDPTQQEYFGFEMFKRDDDELWLPFGYEPRASDPEETDGWGWQAEMIDWWHLGPKGGESKFLMLKARQLGITWLAVAYGIWLLLFRPGSATVCYSHDEESAKKLIQRAWLMYQSLPAPLRREFEVVTPERSGIPSEWIRLRHLPSGRLSTMQALPATKKAGHGDTVTWGIMDEVARMDYAREIHTAINPAVSRGGRLVMISTANGVSNPDTGEGNYFHHLYDTRDEKGLGFRFLPWHLHPERGDHGDEGKRKPILGPGRDPEWYQREAMSLPTVERNQQYPLNETDAFMLSGATYFETDDLEYYRKEPAVAVLQGLLHTEHARKASFKQNKFGPLKVYARPEPDVQYVIGADVASGSGADRSVAHVIDTRNGQVVALLRAKMSPQEFGDELYWLGRWYNTAKIAVERQGGWGEATIFRLRDGNLGRPAYPNLYRHVDATRGKRPIAEQYGMPMNVATRPLVLGMIYKALKDRQFAYLPSETVAEMATFVYRDTKPSPRAMDGCHDDCVMSLAIAVSMLGKYSPAAQAKRYETGPKPKAEYQPLPTRSY